MMKPEPEQPMSEDERRFVAMTDATPPDRADSVACSELVGVSLSDGAKEALRWLWKCDQLQTVRDAREYIEWHWGLEVSAELKAAFSDSPTVRGVPRP